MRRVPSILECPFVRCCLLSMLPRGLKILVFVSLGRAMLLTSYSGRKLQMRDRRRLFQAGVLPALLLAGAEWSAPSPFYVYAAASSPTLFGRISSPAGWGLSSSTVSSPGPDITVLPGQSLDPIISSGDGAPHNWGIDYNGNGMIDLGEPRSNDTSTSTSFTFTATTTPGVYTYWCFIHHGPMHGRFIVEQPPDFLTTPSSSSLTIDQGSSQTSTLTVSSLGGFSGTITFTTPTVPTGIIAALSTTSVTVTPASPGTTFLNVTVGSSAVPGSYSVSTTGSGGGNTHLTSVAIIVVGPDFSVTSNHSSLSITIGSSGNATITVTSQNGFTGTVNLAASVSPSGPMLTLSPTSASLSSGGSATSTLNLSTSNAGPGMYIVMVTATSGSSLSHATSFSLTLSSASSPSPYPLASFPASVLIIIGAVIAASVLVVAVAVLRRKPRS